MSKIEILVKNRNFSQTSNFFKSKFFVKKNEIFPKKSGVFSTESSLPSTIVGLPSEAFLDFQIAEINKYPINIEIVIIKIPDKIESEIETIR